ncbi:MAG: hypothetical protein ACOYN4_22090, partial [Bacteroidales bacterium]
VHFHPQALNWLHFEATYATVIGKQANGDYLPFVPANKLKLEFRVDRENILIFKKPYFSINSSTAFAQNHSAPDETATDGYTLIDLSVGGNLKLNNQLLFVGISASNVLDKKYTDHLSTLKEVNFSNPGRNISLTLKIPFAL